MLNASASDALKYPLKLRDLVVMDLHPLRAPQKVTWGPVRKQVVDDVQTVGLPGDRFYGPMGRSEEIEDYQGATMAVDPSGRGVDETGYAIVKHLHGQLFLTDVGGLKGGYSDETLERLVNLAKAQSVNQIVVESNFGDGMFTHALMAVMKRLEYKCAVEEVRSNVQKEARIIDVLEPVLNHHRLIVDKGLIDADFETAKNVEGAADIRYSLFFQMTRITRERGALRHDDRLDAVAMAVAFWVESMARDTAESVQRARDAATDKDLKDFIASARKTMPGFARMMAERSKKGSRYGKPSRFKRLNRPRRKG